MQVLAKQVDEMLVLGRQLSVQLCLCPDLRRHEFRLASGEGVLCYLACVSLWALVSRRLARSSSSALSMLPRCTCP